jgi:hypothetical protein
MRPHGFKVDTVERVFRKSSVGMHRTFEAMVACEVNAAATGDAMEPSKLLNTLPTDIPSAPAKESD